MTVHVDVFFFQLNETLVVLIQLIVCLKSIPNFFSKLNIINHYGLTWVQHLTTIEFGVHQLKGLVEKGQ